MSIRRAGHVTDIYIGNDSYVVTCGCGFVARGHESEEEAQDAAHLHRLNPEPDDADVPYFTADSNGYRYCTGCGQPDSYHRGGYPCRRNK